MANEIIRHQQLPVNEIMSIGKAFAESGMFPDTKHAAQAIVKIQAGQEIGIPPFAAMTGIHIIQGKPTIGAGLIAAKIKSSGKYDYKVKEQTELKCSIDFYQGKDFLGNSTFTIEDAKKAGTQNTNKFPRNMLFARAISNGVKWFTPDVFMAPVYTPEDFDVIQQQQTEDTATTVIDTKPTTVPPAPQAETKTIAAPTANEETKADGTKQDEPVKKTRLSEKAIRGAIERIHAGEVEIYESIKETCNLSPYQDELLSEAVKYVKSQQEAA